MSTIGELFAPRFMNHHSTDEERFAAMAAEIGADSLRYLPIEAIARAVNHPAGSLCQACLTGEYPTPCGQQLYELAVEHANSPSELAGSRTYEVSIR
jgi:amidophosphoribosyltransferase